MSKNTILSEDNKYERKWFPSIFMDQTNDEKQMEIIYETPDDEIVLLVGIQIKCLMINIEDIIFSRSARVRWIYQVFILLKRKCLESSRTIKEHIVKSLTFIVSICNGIAD